jgi:hypothetical protein
MRPHAIRMSAVRWACAGSSGRLLAGGTRWMTACRLELSEWTVSALLVDWYTEFVEELAQRDLRFGRDGPDLIDGQDRAVSPRMVNGRSMQRVAHLVASAMSVLPASRSAPMARLRREAITRGPDLVRTRESSSR